MWTEVLKTSNPFVSNPKIESVLVIARQYNCLPSSVVGIEDNYTAFCFNEACSYIRQRMDNGDEPIYQIDEEQNKMNYSCASEFFKQYGY